MTIDEQLELDLKDMRTQLEKALADDKHNLAEALTAVTTASEALIVESKKYRAANVALLKEFEVIGASYQDVVAFIKDLHIILNGNQEQALKIKGMAEIMPLLSQFVLSGGAIKAGVVRNA